MVIKRRDNLTVDKSYKALSGCPVPILSSDTHVLSNIAKWKMGLLRDRLAKKRSEELYDIVYKLVREKKLLCPELDIHETESALDSRIAKKAKEISIELSLGIRFRHRQGIEDIQTAMAMKAFIEGKDSVDYQKKWLHMFYCDPIVELNRDEDFIFSIGRNYPEEEIEEMRRKKRALTAELNRIKAEEQNLSISFQKQLEREYHGHLKGILRLYLWFYNALRRGVAVSLEEFMGAQSLALPLAWWRKYGGKPGGIKGLINFYRSKHFKEIPSVEIKCKLWAALAVYNKNDVVKAGDFDDIGMISAILPYAHFLVLDKTMANVVCQKLRLDTKYGAKVFAPKDHDKLMTEFRKLDESPSPIAKYFLSCGRAQQRRELSCPP